MSLESKRRSFGVPIMRSSSTDLGTMLVLLAILSTLAYPWQGWEVVCWHSAVEYVNVHLYFIQACRDILNFFSVTYSFSLISSMLLSVDQAFKIFLVKIRNESCFLSLWDFYCIFLYAKEYFLQFTFGQPWFQQKYNSLSIWSVFTGVHILLCFRLVLRMWDRGWMMLLPLP